MRTARGQSQAAGPHLTPSATSRILSLTPALAKVDHEVT